MKTPKIITAAVIAAAAALSIGYFGYRPEAEEPTERIDITPTAEPNTRTDTVIEYIYSYKGDGITETATAPIPPYLVGLTEAETRESLAGFDVTYFSPEKLTVVKTLDGNSRQHYYLAEKNGYLAVYYKRGGGLKEMTNTPVSSLSDDEKNLLVNTEIVGKTNLARLLEDIES